MAVKKKSSAKKVAVKKAAKKPAAKKSTGTKAASAKAAAAKKPAKKKTGPKLKAITEAMTKSEVIAEIAELATLSKKDVGTVFEKLGELIERNMMKRGAGEFTIPDAGVKIRRIRKGPSKERNGHNPYSGEPMVIPAKKARNVVKTSPLKFLKDAVS